MSTGPRAEPAAGLPRAQQIDQLCDRFEAEWKAGGRPGIEPYLPETPGLPPADLLCELLAVELEYRLRQGERPTPPEYHARFPGRAEAVNGAFARQSVLRAATAVPAAPAPLAPEPIGEAGAIVLAVTAGPHQGRTFSIAGHDTFLVGRSKHAHFQLPDKDRYFSRVHFMLEANPPCCRLTDLGSHNGTYVNSQRVQTADLRDGDLIQAGHTVLRISIPAAPPEPAPPPVSKSSDNLATLTDDAPPAAAGLPAAPVSLGAPTAQPDPAALPPTTSVVPEISGYRLVRELGRGGMGVVYLAVHEADGREVALKTIVPAVVPSKAQIQRFLREANILYQLRHPHIVAFRDLGEAGGRLFFAMDYIAGTDAAHLLAKHGQLPVRTAVRLISQLLLALEYAHAQGYVHRDIKPANLLVTELEGKKIVKLADFGLARVYQASQLSGLTMQGAVGGTFAFMPPEQVTHFREVKPACDQYSVAATLYNLVTGRFIFDFDRPGVQPLPLILHEDPVPIRQRRPDVPEEFAAVVHRALARDPAGRFADARALRQALLPFGQ